MDRARDRAREGDREQPRAGGGTGRPGAPPRSRRCRSDGRADRPSSARSGASRRATSRRGFLGKLGRGVVALAGGGSGRGRARAGAGVGAHHICGHTLHDRLVPASVREVGAHRRASGIRCTRGTATPSTTTARSTRTPRRRCGARSARSVVPDTYHFVKHPRVRRRLDAVLQRPPAAHPGLLLALAHPDQRRRIGHAATARPKLRVFCITYRELEAYVLSGRARRRRSWPRRRSPAGPRCYGP